MAVSPRLIRRAIDPTELTRQELILEQAIQARRRTEESADAMADQLTNFLNSEQGKLAGEVGDRVARERASEPTFDGTGPRPHQQLERQRNETFIGPEGMITMGANDSDTAINIFKATKMNREGFSPSQIWEQTGVIYGPDGHRRMEIPDVDIKYDRPLMDDMLSQGPGANVRLETLISHDGLRDIYPEIFSTRVRVVQRDEDFIARVNFSSSEGRPVIEVNQRLFGQLSGDEQSAVILHEIQHVIQNTEGLPAGTSPNFEAFRWLQDQVPEAHWHKLPGGPDPAGELLRAAGVAINKILSNPEPLTKERMKEFKNLVEIEKLAVQAKRHGTINYYRNIGEVEAFDVEARLGVARSGGPLDFPPALIREIDTGEELMTALPGEPFAAGSSEASGRRPTGRGPVDPRKVPSLLPDGIHYDNAGFPFKVTNKRIVKMDDEEFDEAIINSPLNREDIDEAELIARARQESQEKSRKARQAKVEGEKRARQAAELEEFKSSAEFQRLQEASLVRVQKAREQRFRESPEFQELQQENLNRTRGARGLEAETAPAPAPVKAPKPGGKFYEGDFEKKKKAAIAKGKAKRDKNVTESKESLTARQQEQFDEARLAAENRAFEHQRDSIYEVATMADMDDAGLFDDLQGFLDEVNALAADGVLPEARKETLVNFYLERVHAAGKSDAMERMFESQPTPVQQQQARHSDSTALFDSKGPFDIIDNQTGEVVGTTTGSHAWKRARSRRDKLDNEYGAVRYTVRERRGDAAPRQDTPVQQQQARDVRGGITGDTDPRFVNRAEDVSFKELQSEISQMDIKTLSSRYNEYIDELREGSISPQDPTVIRTRELFNDEFNSRGVESEFEALNLMFDDSEMIQELEHALADRMGWQSIIERGRSFSTPDLEDMRSYQEELGVAEEYIDLLKEELSRRGVKFTFDERKIEEIFKRKLEKDQEVIRELEGALKDIDFPSPKK